MTPQSVMAAIVAEIEVFSEVPDAYIDTPNEYVRDFYAIGVPYAPCVWFGTLSAAQRMHISRITRFLERSGSLVRITEQSRDRVSHVRPLPKGIVATVDLANGKADPTAIVAGLGRTLWGPPLIRQFLRLLRAPESGTSRRTILPMPEIAWQRERSRRLRRRSKRLAGPRTRSELETDFHANLISLDAFTGPGERGSE